MEHVPSHNATTSKTAGRGLRVAALAALGSTVVSVVATIVPAARGFGAQPLHPKRVSRQGPTVPGRYLVEVRAVASPAAVSASFAQALRASDAPSRFEAHQVFEFAFHGFEATLSEADVQAMLASDDVIRLHPVQAMTLQDARIALPSLDPALPWGLDRIDQEAFPLDGRYLGKRKGAGVDVYVLDSGIRADHVEFGGRARVVLDTTGETREPPQDDCNGHGTHVAGTAAGATVGVAPAANIIGMKVYSCATGGSDARLLAAFEWLLKNARTPAVVNVSLAGEEPGPSDAAIARLREKGIAVVVGAANSFDDACKFSPARVPEAITVGASSQTIDFEGNLIDSLAFFSNYGTCVDILAPGTQIRSAWKNGTDSYAGLDGTSMATPHVTGALALMLEDNPRMNVDALESRLYETAFKGRIEFSLGDRGTPRRLLNTLWNSTR